MLQVLKDEAGPVATGGGSSSPFGFDPLAAIALFRRRSKLFLITALALFIVVVGYSLQLTPKYTAAADVLIDTRRAAAINIDAVMSGLSSDTNSVDTQVQILTSRSLAERVVRKLRLQEDPEFNPHLDVRPSLIGRIIPGAAPAAQRPNPNSQRVIDATVQQVLSGLRVERAGLTYIMKVSYTARDPQKAAKIANAFADEYIVDQLEAKYTATETVNDWLGERLITLRQEVEAADARVEQYKVANGLMSAQGATMAEQEVSVLNSQIAAARAERAEKIARLEAARQQLARGGGGADVGAALGSSTISTLRAQEAETSRRLAELNARYGPRHPEVQKAEGQLGDVKAQIQSEINRIISNLEAEVRVASDRAGSLASSQGAARGTLAANSRAQVGLMELQRKADASRAIYESLLNRSKETAAQEGIQQPDARVLSYSRQGRQSYPNLAFAVAIGLVLGLMCGAAAVVIAELFETGFATADSVERRLRVPHLASLPLAPKNKAPGAPRVAPQDYLADHPLSAFAEAFRNLRASLVLAPEAGEAPRVIAVCSALPHEGKTVTAFGLMRTIALAGAKVVLVDADLRRRGVSKLARAGGAGLVEVLEGELPWEKAIVADPASGGFVLPVAKTPDHGEDLLGSGKMDALIEQLKARFDMVIIDTPPVLALAESRLVAAKTDGVVFVIRWRKTPGKAAEIALSTLSDSGVTVLGVALSQVDFDRQRAFGYGDGSYYYSNYRDYYAK